MSSTLNFLKLNFPTSFSELSETTFSGWLKKAQRDDKEGVKFPKNYPEIKTMVIIKNENLPRINTTHNK